MTSTARRTVSGALLLVFAGGFVAGCSRGGDEGHPNVAMASAKERPVAVKRSPTTVLDSYRFAVANLRSRSSE